MQPPQLGGPTFGINRVLDRNRQTFLAGFHTPTSSVTEYQLGIQQALTLMNGDFTTDATNLERSDILVSLSAPFFSEEERLETLFLAALRGSRPKRNGRGSCRTSPAKNLTTTNKRRWVTCFGRW